MMPVSIADRAHGSDDGFNVRMAGAETWRLISLQDRRALVSVLGDSTMAGGRGKPRGGCDGEAAEEVG